MQETTPVVYVLHGDDEFSITQYTAGLKAKLGDSAIAGMNYVQLDGRSASLEEIETNAVTIPFLVSRKVVVVTHPTARLSVKESQERFLRLLEKLPHSVALALVEYRFLTQASDRRKNKIHWLEKWASEAGDRVLLKSFSLPKGGALVQRVQEIARTAGGQITGPAAELLASLVGENPRVAEQEIQKLLAYTNYTRQIQPEDVEAVTADQGHGDVFAMVDAIGNRDGRRAIDMLHRLLEEQDAISIFGMVTRQFRLLLLTREFLDEGGQIKDAARLLKQHPYVMDKIGQQARRFDLPGLEAIYRRLLEIDEAVKSGGIEAGLALDLLIAAVTQPV